MMETSGGSLCLDMIQTQKGFGSENNWETEVSTDEWWSHWNKLVDVNSVSTADDSCTEGQESHVD